MRAIRIFLACLLAIPVSAGDRRPSASLETEIARIDGLVADHDTKFQVIEAMARDLGTHRNHLVLLKKQELDSFAQIYVKELRKRGFNDEATLKKLQLIGSPGEPTPSSSGFTPIAFVGTAVDHNSAGTFVSISPEVGIDSHHFAFVVGVPFYRISATQRDASGIGDVYASMFLRQSKGPYEIGGALTIGAPTGDTSQGLGAGRLSVDANATLRRRFERLSPFLNGGYTNSLFNNVGYQRPFISNGNSVYASGGLDYRMHRRFTVGMGGFGLMAMGDQMVISQMTSHSAMTDTPSTPGMPGMPSMPGMPGMPPGMGSGSTGAASMGSNSLPFYGHAPHATVPGSDVSDYGASAWASWSLTPFIKLNFSVARSIPYELTTVRVGIGFDLSSRLERLLRK